MPGAFSLERIAISDAITQELVKVMNHIHGVNYSYRFWKIVMGDYVNALVSIKHILERQEMKSQPPLEPVNSHHVPSFKERIIARLPAVVKHFKNWGCRSQIFSLLQSQNNISISLPDIDAVRNDTGPVLPLYYPIFPGSGSSNKRKRANELVAQYDTTFYRNMVAQVPQIYVEHFDSLYNGIPLHKPGEKIFHSHGMPPFYSALIIAKYLNHGAKLYCYQHGAYYGEMIGHNSHYNESSVSDEFRTWGWKIRDNDVPWKAYRLEKFKLNYEKEAGTNEYDLLMCYPDVYDANREHFKTITAYFFNNLDADKYKKIMARPRPMNKMFSHANRLSFINDNRVTVDSGLGNMTGAIAKSRLVIQFTIPATNFFECLYVDHPTIGILDNDQPTAAVKPYYDFLVAKGMIHTDFAALVDHLNKIDLDEWWSSLTKEPMYAEFKNKFLRKV